MAQYRHTIEVTARFVDNLSSGARGASDSLGGIGESAEKSQKKVDRLDRMMSKLEKFRQMTIGIKDSGAYKTLKKITDTAESLTKKTWTAMVKVKDLALAPIRAIKNALFSIPTLITAVIGAKIVQQGVLQPINLADSYSSAKIGFSTLLGASGGQQMMNKLDEFAKATPFKTSNVIANAQKMMAMGWDVETLVEDMEIIGNAAAATGKMDQGLESIVRALSQIKTKGKLSTEELNQLAEAGISAKSMLAEGLGYGTGDEGIAAMTADLEEGAIASNQAIQALLKGMQKYDGMMNSMANETVEGLMSQMADVFEINIFRKWGQGLQDGAKRGFGTLVSLLDKAETSLSKLGDVLYEIGVNVSNWVADKLENALKRIQDITGTFEFEKASLGEKISMLWKGLIVDPLKEWWDGGGKDKTTKTAAKIGKWMGEMLTKSLLAILGITDLLKEGGLDESAGVTVAQSFAKGFAEGFDVTAITDKLVEAIKNVWNALPTWGKLLVGGYGAAKIGQGIGWLASGIGSIMSFIGSPGLWGTGGSGALGLLSKIGYGALGKMGSKASASIIGTSGGMAAAGGAGAVSMIAGGIKAIGDFIQAGIAFSEGDSVEGDARLASGGSTLGGIAAGAAIGTLIAPGIGTLIGGGIGAIVGSLGGDAWAESIRKGAREEEAKKRFETKAMQDAFTSGVASTTALKELFEKEVWQNFRDHMGDISLTLGEVEALAGSYVWGELADDFESLNFATESANANLQNFKAALEQSKEWMWRARIGAKFSEDDIEAFRTNINDFITSSKSLIENERYKFTTALGIFADPESLVYQDVLKGGDAYYAEIQKQVEDLSAQLEEAVNDALADGKISTEPIMLPDGTLQLSEYEEIISLQEQIADITSKLADAESTAEIELAKIKLDTGKLNVESWQMFTDALTANVESRMAQEDAAFTAALKPYVTMRDEGTITEDEYNAVKEQLQNQWSEALSNLSVEIRSLHVEMMSEAYANDIGVTLTQATDVINRAIDRALTTGIDPVNWSEDIMKSVFGGGLSDATMANLQKMLSATFSSLNPIKIRIPTEPTFTGLDYGLALNTMDMLNNLGIATTVDETITLKLDGAPTYTPIPEENQPTGADFGLSNSIDHNMTINITATPKYSGSGYFDELWADLRGPTPAGFAAGGLVRGGAQLVTVAEEGTPEMIIPLGSQRRERGLKLWMQAGRMLGVAGARFARGGLTTGGPDEGIRFTAYGSTERAGGGEVQVDVGGVNVTIHVDAGSADNVAAAIKAQSEEIAETVAEILADELGAQFASTPLKGGAA